MRDDDWDARGSYVDLHSRRLAQWVTHHHSALWVLTRYMRLRNWLLRW